MTTDLHKDVITIGIGGAAGDGVREAGQSMGTMLTDLGYEVFISFTYPSLIRGGHNFSRISFSKEKIWSDHSKLDVLIALNEETVKLHESEMNPDSVIFADAFEARDMEKVGENAGEEKVSRVVLPMLLSSQELGAPPITRNSVALGATCYLMDLHFPAMQKVLQGVFKEKRLEANIKLADIGFEYLKKLNFRHTKHLMVSAAALSQGKTSRPRKELLDGNVSFAKGLQVAGLEFYIAYPMTPATSILHYLAGQQVARSSDVGKNIETVQNSLSSLRVIQPEGELSVINMALGIAYAGKRVAIGSATGGFQLMQEAFSFAGIAELPLVIAVSQRQAPATGVPTYSSQTDLRLAIHAGHGEFPRIVIAPGDTEESFHAGATALNLAWKYQLPVIVLLDKILSEHSATTLLGIESKNALDGGVGSSRSIGIERGRIAHNSDEKYGRYEVSPDGISPMAFPGTPNTVVKVTSYEHNSSGITIEEAAPVKEMIDKRFAKAKTLLEELPKQETVKVYGDKDSRDVIVFWGSTKGPVLEASKYFNKPFKLVQILWAEPFDSEKVKRELAGAKRIIDIECNHDAQMAALIREKTGIEITEKILRYDSRPFDVMELAEEVNK